MSSWRDTASAPAQEDLDELLNAVLGFAQQQLSAHGEFYPYAAAIDSEGEVVMIAARPDPNDEHPRSADVVAACLGTLTDRRQRIRAGAIVTDVRVQDGGDAIRVDLEHAEGHAHTVLQPYTKKRLSKKIEFGQLRAQARQRQIWS